MADFLRPEIVVILKEYEQIAEIQRNNDSVVFKDIFNGNALKTENFTVEDFYQAMAWAGLVEHIYGEDLPRIIMIRYRLILPL